MVKEWALGGEFKRTIEKLESLQIAHTDIRIVFWFDN
jgi:hypothetical protein